MGVPHPDYPHIQVRKGVDGEAPEVGAFYAAKKGDTLSSIATSLVNSKQVTVSRLYDAIALINSNAWNRKHCHFRAESANCSSKRVDKGGYIAFCQADVNDDGKSIKSKYPVIWIPSTQYANPEEVPLPSTLPAWLKLSVVKPTPEAKPHILTPQELADRRAKAAAVAAQIAAANANYTYTVAPSGDEPNTDTGESSSTLMWVGVAIAVAAVGGILYATTRGKR